MHGRIATPLAASDCSSGTGRRLPDCAGALVWGVTMLAISAKTFMTAHTRRRIDSGQSTEREPKTDSGIS